jgi:hypothetical protein
LRKISDYRSYQKKGDLSRQVRQARKGHPTPAQENLIF